VTVTEKSTDHQIVAKSFVVFTGPNGTTTISSGSTTGPTLPGPVTETIPGEDLAFTGTNAASMAPWGVAAILAGTCLMLLGALRRQRPEHKH
jgi:hypothetical protein